MLGCCYNLRARASGVLIKVQPNSSQSNDGYQNQVSTGAQNYSPFAVGYPLPTQFVPKLSAR